MIRKISLVFALAMLIAGLRQAAVSPSVCRFVHYYRAAGKTNAPRNLWERIITSFALATESQQEHGSA